MHQIVQQLGFAPDPTRGAHSALSEPLARTGGEERTGRGGEGREKNEGKGREVASSKIKVWLRP